MITISLRSPLSQDMLEAAAKPQVMAIGQFDGIHLGHASVIRTAIELAQEQGLQSSVMTFHPHPKEVMGRGEYEGYLTPLAMKERILADMGVDVLYLVEFSDAFSHMTPAEFVEMFLLQLQVRTAVVGFDFRFGHLGEGDEARLRELGSGRMHVITVPPLEMDGEKVSSSRIRASLLRGELEQANRWFGRPYTLRGTVVDGEKRGRTIGFPTANITLEDRFVVPAKGVYAVKVQAGDRKLLGVMNAGVKPTFHDGEMKPSFEVHLFDFSEQIYGEMLTVELIRFIRSERKFGSVDELIVQIREDAKEAKTLLTSGRG
ncbi:bifunctional riboflavin kinase/FAD synthetase [Paenibacillus sp. JX-17]|uniref:Riboflavin biosynthesis protein n=1 Tax=Paenibacillus lacisoli TaxID=3064525 RepID=A0ABT9CAV5_9BACL|nr:bifunctional riboflavin kinase/FAD synthetase [Paenibacillus sp. JX-17]MDO7905784.1 bifunctional riboflavin kinase/FAD synthetase [Paenibacillus sp. JX-17]